MKTQPMPNSYEIEQAVLGAIMLDYTAFFRINELQRVTPDDFYNDRHKNIMAAVLQLNEQKKQIDLCSVTMLLGIDYGYEITELCNRVTSTANIESHVLILKELSIRRQTIINAYTTIQKCYDIKGTDIFEMMLHNQKQSTSMLENLGVSEESLEGIFNKIDNVVYGRVSTTSFLVCRTGLHKLDGVISGIEIDDIIVLAGISGSGKTALMCNNIVKMLQEKKHVAVFSYEMSAQNLMYRIISNITEIAYEDIKKGRVTAQDIEIYEAAKREILEGGFLHIYSCAGMPLQGLVAKATALKMRLGQIGGIFIDYLQLIPTETKHKDENAVAKEIMTCLMFLMKQLECPIIILSQLNKSVGEERPKVGNIMGAQITEATATKILLIHRPEKFEKFEFEDGTNALGMAEIIVGKNREGVPDSMKVRYKGEFYKFDNEYQEPQHQTYYSVSDSDMPF
jgi:replicative DNA helicase